MNPLTESQTNWNQTKAKVKQNFAMLTEGDVLLTKGQQDKMLDRLGIKLGKTKEELTTIIANL